MNRNIIKALLRLFSLVARSGSDSGRGRIVVENFLRRQLDSEQIDAYLHEFDEHISGLQEKTDEQKERKRTSASSVRVLRICTQINEELTHSQKCIVLVRLIEFLSADGDLSQRDTDFVLTAGTTFNIPDNELEQCVSFAGPHGGPRDKGKWLILSNGNYGGTGESVKVEGLEAEIPVILLESAGICFIRMHGSSLLFLNGQQMKHGSIYSFPQGAVLRGPRIQPVYYSDVMRKFLRPTAEEKFVFAAKQIEYNFPNGKKGLHKFSFSEESGNMIGIMGSSGAGKSTLLNILNGNEMPFAGKVVLNGYDIHEDTKKTEGLIGYVSQDDLLIEELTVFQNLWFNAKLCFSGLSKQDLLKKVHKTLAELGLMEIRDLKVSNPLNKTISGGQRKRLNIALELIREPAVLFVDEPTSGLSSRDSEQIMDLLKELALKGKLVFVVIHQPSSTIFKMFDRLLLLDTGGFPVYYGNPVESVLYFKSLVDHGKATESECRECGNVNPEQIFDMLEARVIDEHGLPTSTRKISAREWNIFFKRSIPPVAEDSFTYVKLPESGFRKLSRVGQFIVFFSRDFIAKLSNAQYMVINLLEAPLLALLMGYLLRYSKSDEYTFYDNLNVPAYLLVCVIASLFFGLTVSAEEIFRDKKILKREKFLNLSRLSYLTSKVAVLFLLSAIQSLTFVIAGHMMMGISGLYWADFLVLFSVSCFANLLGLNISSTFNSAVTIYILIPILIIPQLLLSGVLVRFENLNRDIHPNPAEVPFAADLMASRWAYEALAVNRFMNNPSEKPVFQVNIKISSANYLSNYWVARMEELSVKALEEEIAKKETTRRQALVKEIDKLNSTRQFTVFPSPERIMKPDGFSAIEPELNDWLLYVTALCNQREKEARVEKDRILRDKGFDIGAFKEKYTNAQLVRLLTYSDNFDKIKWQNDGTLSREFEPVYSIPVKGVFAAGHFYAPYKRVFNAIVPTLWANMMIVWFMTAVLFFLLRIDGLKNLMQLIEKGMKRLRWNSGAGR